MNAQQLKDSILQYAMQGKLVPQNQNDEPVTTLIENIQEEKERLVEQKIIKKRKYFPSINEVEKPFDIPESWEWIRLGSITHFIKAGGDKPKEFTIEKTDNHLVPVIANGKKNKGVVGYTSVAKVEGNTLTISGRGTIGYAEIRNEPYVPIVRLLYLKAATYISLEYLKYVLEAFLERGVGTSIRQLTVPMVETKIIPLPPINEQVEIVKKINVLFNKIDVYEKVKEEQEEIQAVFPIKLDNSILHYAMQGKLVEQDPSDEPAIDLVKRIRKEKEKLIAEKIIKKEKALPPISNEEIPFDIPDSWEWTRLGDLTLKNTGGGTPSKSNPYYWNGEIAWASVKDLKGPVLKSTQDTITELGLKNSSSNLIPPNNLIIFTRMGLGKIAINSMPVAINQDLRALQLSEEIQKKFVIYYFKTIVLDGKGATVKGINLSQLNNLLIPIPPINEQKRILKAISDLHERVDYLSAKTR